MYETNVTQNFINAITDSVRSMRCRVEISGQDPITEGIVSSEMSFGSAGADAYGIGTIFFPAVTLSLYPPAGVTFSGKNTTIKLGVTLDDGTVEYVPMGVFLAPNADSVERTQDLYTIRYVTTSETILSGQYVPGVTFPATVAALAADVQSKSGITVDTSHLSATGKAAQISAIFEEEIGEDPDIETEVNYIYSDALRAAAKAARCTVTIDRSGHVVFVPYPETIQANYSIAADLVKSSSVSETMLDDWYYPGSCEFMGDPRLDPWDVVSFTDPWGETQVLPCMAIDHVYDGGLTTTITAPAKKEEDLEGTFGQKLERTTQTVVEATRVLATKISAAEADIKYATIANLNAAKADIQSLQASTADIATIRAQAAQITELDADVADFKEATADNFEATNASITDLDADVAAFKTATATNFSAVNADIDDLDADVATFKTATAANFNAVHADIDDLDADVADFKDATAENFTAVNADIEDLDADVATFMDTTTESLTAAEAAIGVLDTNKADIDLANVNNAWISNGVVKNAAISDAQIIGVSANKLTAGTIDASKITVTNLNADNINAGSLSVGGVTLNLTADTATIDGSAIEDGSITLSGLAKEVTDAIDGAIQTWTVTGVPTLSNVPANAWTTTAERKKHVGDIAYVVNAASQVDGYSYRFAETNGAFSWALIKDTDITKVLQEIVDINGEITGIKSFNTEVSQWQTELEGGLETVKSRTTTIETTYATKTVAQGYATAAQTAAASDATAKANAAQTAATTAAKNYTDSATEDMATTGDIPTKVSDLTNDSGFQNSTQVNSAITSKGYQTSSQVESAITSKGYATTGQVATAKSEAITAAASDATTKANNALTDAKAYTDAMEIGGRNLIQASFFKKEPWTSSGVIINPSLEVDEKNVIHISHAKLYGATSSGTTSVFPDMIFEETTQYTLSVEWANAGSINGSMFFIFRYSDGTSSGRIYCTTFDFVTTTLTSAINKSVVGITMSYATGGYGTYIANIKLEKGTKATDWTPAPEDVANDIETAKAAAIASANDYADEVVSTKVEVSTFNDLVDTVDEHTQTFTTLSNRIDTKADGSTVTTLSNTVNTVQQTANSNSQSISSLTTTVNSKANTSTVNEKFSEIEQDLDGFKSTVSATYATKTEVDTEVSQLESSISQQADEIALKVNKNGVISEINQTSETIKIAANKVELSGYATFTALDEAVAVGKNLILKSNRIFANTDYLVAEYKLSEEWLPNQQYTIRLKGTIASGTNLVIYINGAGIKLVGNMTKKSNGTFVLTATSPASITSTLTKTLRVYNTLSTATHNSVIEWIKMEKGGTATAWSPAPEDNITKLSELDNDSGFQNSTQVNSAITSKGYQTSSQVESAITSKGYQTSSQVNTAITSKGYQTSSQVENAITSKGYATTTEVGVAQAAATAAANAYTDALEVGGRNLVLKSNEPIDNSKYDVAVYSLSENWIVGQPYTCTIKGSVANGTFNVYMNNTDASSEFGTGLVSKGNGLYSLTFTPTAVATSTPKTLRVYNRPQTAVHDCTIEWIKLEKGTKATDWIPAPEDVDDNINTAKDIAVSGGEQLVLNGNGILGNNYNFSMLEFDGSQANSSAGSFTKSAGYVVVRSDNFIPVDGNTRYIFDMDARSKNGATRMYSMVLFFDSDKYEISAAQHMYIANTLTTLSQALSKGDTVVHLTSLTNWKVNTGTSTHQRGFIFWNYKNNSGYEYPELTYSRNVYVNRYASDSDVNKTTNTITLSAPWNGPDIPAGTKVSQSSSGLTYKYQGMSAAFPPANWTHYSGYYDGVDYSGANVGTKLPPGTSYAKIGFLWDYGSLGTGDQVWVTNISLKTDTQHAIDTAAASTLASAEADATDKANTARAGAFSDVQDDLESAAGTTVIHGGHIMTKTLTAEQINVEDIFAQDITASGTITGATLQGATGSFDSGYVGGFEMSYTPTRSGEESLMGWQLDVSEAPDTDTYGIPSRLVAGPVIPGASDYGYFSFSTSGFVTDNTQYNCLVLEPDLSEPCSVLEALFEVVESFGGPNSIMDFGSVPTNSYGFMRITFSSEDDLDPVVIRSTRETFRDSGTVALSFSYGHPSVIPFTPIKMELFMYNITMNPYTGAITYVDQDFVNTYSAGTKYTVTSALQYRYTNSIDGDTSYDDPCFKIGTDRTDVQYVSGSNLDFRTRMRMDGMGFAIETKGPPDSHTEGNNTRSSLYVGTNTGCLRFETVSPGTWSFDSAYYGSEEMKLRFSSATMSFDDTGLHTNKLGTDIFSLIYPVGSIYMSVNNVNPSTFFGGTWVAWGGGRVPVGVNTADANFNSVEKTGGASAVTLTAAQSGVPVHGHGFTQPKTPAHSHPAASGRDFVTHVSGYGVTEHVVKSGSDTAYKYIAATNAADDWYGQGSTGSGGGSLACTGGAVANNTAANASAAHTNLQPYITCYMWKRTA